MIPKAIFLFPEPKLIKSTQSESIDGMKAES